MAETGGGRPAASNDALRCVDQTVFVEAAGRGDCLRATVATILGLSSDEVPDFGCTNARREGQWIEFTYWLRERGLGWQPVYPWEQRAEDHLQRYVIGSGQTLRGTHHAVVVDLAVPIVDGVSDGSVIEAGQPIKVPHVAHDPHPSRAGLVFCEHLYEIIPRIVGER